MTLRELESAIASLPPKDLRRFRAWFAEFDAQAWDEELEQDAMTGRLDKVAEEALRDYRDGKCTEL